MFPNLAAEAAVVQVPEPAVHRRRAAPDPPRSRAPRGHPRRAARSAGRAVRQRAGRLRRAVGAAHASTGSRSTSSSPRRRCRTWRTTPRGASSPARSPRCRGGCGRGASCRTRSTSPFPAALEWNHHWRYSDAAWRVRARQPAVLREPRAALRLPPALRGERLPGRVGEAGGAAGNPAREGGAAVPRSARGRTSLPRRRTSSRYGASLVRQFSRSIHHWLSVVLLSVLAGSCASAQQPSRASPRGARASLRVSPTAPSGD